MKGRKELDKTANHSTSPSLRNKSKFYYVRGVLGDPRLIKDHIKAIKRLTTGNFSEADLEKLKGTEDVYSYRLNKVERLLFTFTRVNGQEYPVILDYLPTHDYHKSRFLRRGVLKRYLENQNEVFKQLGEEENETLDYPDEEPLFEPCSAAELTARLSNLALDDENECEVGVLEYYQQNFIELSPTQQQALKIKLPAPAVVGGVAGSGKSCAAFALLTSYISALQQTNHDDQEKLDETDKKSVKLLYVTQSELLVKTMATAWENLPRAGEKENVHIEFKAYRQLLEDFEKADLVPAGFETFTSWYEQYIKQAKKVARTKEQTTPMPELSSKTAYQECRIRSGYSPEKYLDLGKKQSQLQQHERSWLNQVYSDYLKHLASKNKFAPEFSPLALKDYYDLIVVDEAQDLSPGQLISLSRAAKKQAIVYYMDSHQRLFDERSIRLFLLEELHIDKENHIELGVMYRCPPKIQAVANEAIALKHRLVTGVADPYEPTKIKKTLYAEESQGHVHLLDMNMLADCTWMREQPLGTNFAVVTLECHREEAKKYFNTPLIFTPEEIKGLEYDFVVAYRLYPSTLFKEAQQRLNERGDAKQPTHQAKSETRDDHYIPPLNAIYTSYTRPKHALVICEDFTRENEILLKHVRPIADKGFPSKEELQQANQVAWQQEVAKQKTAGNLALAATIEETKLAQTKLNSQAIKPKAETKRLRKRTNKTAKRKKKSPRQHSPQTVPTKPRIISPEETNAIMLYYEFDERRFGLALRYLDVYSLLLKKYQTATDSFVLLEKLIKEDKINILLSCAANNLNTLLNIPFDKLLGSINNNRSRTHQKAYSLLSRMPSIRQNLEQLMRKSKLSKNLLDENTTPAYLDIDRGTCKNLSELHAMGADLNKVADLAAEIGKIKYLKILKTLGVDFEIANTFGTTPAYIAADKGHIEVIKLFKKWGVQLDKSGHVGGKSLIHAAVFRGHTTLLKLFHSWGLKMDIPDEEGRPPIFMALINGNMEVLELFKDLGIKLDTPDRDGNTIIHLAAQRASLVALKFFHIWGMKLDTPNNNYQSPAHLATDHNNLNVLIWFQSWGVNLDISLPNDTTLMYIAASCGRARSSKSWLTHNSADLLM